MKTKIKVYLVDGRVYEYFVDNPIKAREHAHRIITNGWRNCEEGRECYYPVWQVLKVTFNMPNLDELSGKYFAQPAMTVNQENNKTVEGVLPSQRLSEKREKGDSNESSNIS